MGCPAPGYTRIQNDLDKNAENRGIYGMQAKSVSYAFRIGTDCSRIASWKQEENGWDSVRIPDTQIGTFTVLENMILCVLCAALERTGCWDEEGVKAYSREDIGLSKWENRDKSRE